MKTLVISDLHNHVDWVEPALMEYLIQYQYDEVVFLGDYFDNFHDTPFIASKTADWLKGSLMFPNRIHLVGNHDMPYMCPANASQWCPGFDRLKLLAINSIITPADWAKLRPAYHSNGWLFSHAGFQEDLIPYNPEGAMGADELVRLAEEALERVKRNEPDPLFLPGARFGQKNTGGITWCDWEREFLPYPHINQMVGHTPGSYPRAEHRPDSKNYCVDCYTTVTLITDGEVEFIKKKSNKTKGDPV